MVKGKIVHVWGAGGHGKSRDLSLNLAVKTAFKKVLIKNTGIKRLSVSVVHPETPNECTWWDGSFLNTRSCVT